MAVGDATHEMLKLKATRNQRKLNIWMQVLPLSLLLLALVLTTGMAFFRFDFWLMGAAFIAAGALVVSMLIYLTSKRVRANSGSSAKSADVRHLGTGTLSTFAGTMSLFIVSGDFGTHLGDYKVFVAQIGFALMIVGGFWLVMTVRDMV